MDSPRPRPECLDADVLARWAEHAVSAAEAAAIETHVADCDRCQALVATFALTEDLAVAAAPARARPWWRQWWMPLTGVAAAAAVTIAFVLTRAPGAPAPVATTAMTPTDAPVAMQAPAPAATLTPTPTPQAPTPRTAPTPSTTAASTREAKTTTETKTSAAAPVTVTALAAPPTVPPPGVPGGVGGGVASAAPPTPPAPAASASAPPPAPAARVLSTNLAPSAAAVRETWSIVPLAAFSSQLDFGAGRGGARAVVNAPTVATTYWRILTSTRVSRSNDNREWTSIDLAAFGEIALAAGAAPTPSVCWLVGARGLVLRTTDGATFVKLPFPEAVDLTAIQSILALEATVTTRDGRRFRTMDGGQTWKIVPGVFDVGTNRR